MSWHKQPSFCFGLPYYWFFMAYPTIFTLFCEPRAGGRTVTRACTLYHWAYAAQVRSRLSFLKLFTDTWSGTWNMLLFLVVWQEFFCLLLGPHIRQFEIHLGRSSQHRLYTHVACIYNTTLGVSIPLLNWVCLSILTMQTLPCSYTHSTATKVHITLPMCSASIGLRICFHYQSMLRYIVKGYTTICIKLHKNRLSTRRSTMR